MQEAGGGARLSWLERARADLERTEPGEALQELYRILTIAELSIAHRTTSERGDCQATVTADSIAENARRSGDVNLMVQAARLQIAAGQPPEQVVPTLRAAASVLDKTSDGFAKAEAAIGIATIARSLKTAEGGGSEWPEYLASRTTAIRRAIDAYLRTSDSSTMKLVAMLQTQSSGAMTFSAERSREEMESIKGRVNRMKDLLYYGESRFVPAVGTLSLERDGSYTATAREDGFSAVVSFVPVDRSKPYGTQAISALTLLGERGVIATHRMDSQPATP